MILTTEGTRLAKGLAEGIRTIGEALDEVKASSPDTPIGVSLTPAFAAQCLIPRLQGFWSAHPDAPISLHPDKRVTDLRREAIDLGIRFGNGTSPGLDVELLTASQYVIVAAPSLLAGHKDLSPLAPSAMPWVIEQGWPEAQSWLRSFGLHPDAMNISYIPTEELALSAARQGYGLHVEAAALVEQDVVTYALKVVGIIRDDSLAYYLVSQLGPKRPALQTFKKWLKAAV